MRELAMSIGYQQKGIVRFGEFELDPAGELRADGKKVKLQDQPLQILQFLIRASGPDRDAGGFARSDLAHRYLRRF